MNTRTVLAGVAALAIALSSAPAKDDVELHQVPEEVRETALDAIPGGRLVSVSVETENGVKIYEFIAEDADGEELEIDVFEDGRLEEVERVIDFEDIPNVVRDALAERAPDFVPRETEWSYRGDGKIVYEFSGKYRGAEIDAEITEDGEILLFDDDADS
ncbi:MAG: hypothetical protein AAFR11_02730 [Pseudomonadota bacterium]